MALLASGLRILRTAESVTYRIPVRTKKKMARQRSAAVADGGDIETNVDMAVYDTSMAKAVDAFQKGLSRLRSSGATPDLLDRTYS